MRVPWLGLMGPGLLFGSIVEGAPGSHHKRKPYDPNDPGASSSQAPITPIGYNYGYIQSADPGSPSTSRASISYAPACSDWVYCPTCPKGYYCPSAEATASPTQSLVIVPTCPSWKACPECRGGYKCWKPRSSTEAPVETSSASLIVAPTCYPWYYCYNCVGGYSCSSDPGLTASTITTPEQIIYATLRPSSSVTKGPGATRNTKYLPTCSDFVPCPTCSWGWSCPVSDPTDQTYTIVITRGTDYTTVTETIPASYDGYVYGTYDTSQPSETTSAYDWASYDQPTCPDYIICPTCALGYYCPSASVRPTPVYYWSSSQDPDSTSNVSLLPSFYPPPLCDNYVVCQDCFLGYYCPGPSPATPTASEYPPKSYGSPPCDDYIVCPTCSLGFYCPPNPSSGLFPNPTAIPSYGTPSCSDYIVCPSCALGYYCPTATKSYRTDPTSTYNWASYEQPSCPDYVVCPSCPLGYYCPTPPTTANRIPKAYTSPTCPGYIVCPSCALGDYCPSMSATPTRPVYNTKSSGKGYSSKTQNPYVPSTTYYIGLPTTTLVVAPTCSEYVLCPVCPGGYFCSSASPRQTMSTSVPYYYTDPNASEAPIATIPPCDAYVFCPECKLGYSCLVRSYSSTTKNPKPYRTGGTAKPPISNPYPLYTSQLGTPTIDGTYVTAPENPGYGFASLPAPGLPTCASYVLCPTCPLGYYCASIVSPTVAPSTYYGVAPTGVVEPVYSTTVILPLNTPPSSCPTTVRTVTMTKTRDIYRLYNICAPDPYAVLTSFVIPTVTISQCDPETPPPYTQPTSASTSSSDCSTCDPDGNFYTVTRPTDFSPVSFTNWGQGRPYSRNTAGTNSPTGSYDPNSPQTSTSCSFKPCDGGYYCETCSHKWYCPTSTNGTPNNTPYTPVL
ncbi:hypothetical protein TWF506_001508 [Arthrobotrys conoides]|uniref:Uncharacterized protein n=1 Tax=Arthrobotrys conoides TaxID=74498 RepID=A0AAN8NT91_9PEZI